MTPLRVLHVIESMIQGGAESLILEHLRHASPGTESSVCALNRGGPALEQAKALGARTELLGKGARRLDGLSRLAALMRERHIDAVNGHNPVGSLYATLAAMRAGVPVVVRTEHSIHYPGRHSRLYTLVLEPLLTLRASAVICVCEAVRRSHAGRLGWADARFVTIDNGISEASASPSREAVRIELGIGPGEPLVLTVGSLTPQKAQRILLEAFARVRSAVPAARLAIAGSGALEHELRGQAATLGISDRVSFLGAREDVTALLAASDVFVLSSVREGLSVTLLEAMRAARPVVATRVGGTADVVEDGVTGLIVAPRDAPQLAGALVALLDDRPRAARMAAAGRARWEQHFRAERMVADTEALYRRLLAGGPARDGARPGRVANAPGSRDRDASLSAARSVTSGA